MTTNPSSPTQPTARLATPSLDAFFAAVRDSNPFADVRVKEPSTYDIDVPTIHADSFDRLVNLALRAHHNRSAIGTVLLGGAGVGKSHLLSRLFRWATKEDHARYVLLNNLQADPERLP